MKRVQQSPVRRTGVLVACGALLVAGLTGSPEARAADDEPSWQSYVDADSFTIDGPGSCDVTGIPDPLEGDPAPGTTETHSFADELSITRSLDETDTQTVAVAGTSKFRRTDAGGGLERAWLTAEAEISGSAALGDETDCETFVDHESEFDIRSEVPSDGFVELELRTTGDMLGGVGFLQESTRISSEIIAGSLVKRGTVASFRTFVEAGEIRVFGYTELSFVLPEREGGGVMRRAATDIATEGTAYAELSFVAAGSAVSGAKGSGKKYVSLGQRSCGNDKVTTTMKKKAKKAKKVTYYVDGSKAKTVGKPKKGKTVKLAVPAASDATVKVVVKPKKGKNVSVTRSYVACTG